MKIDKKMHLDSCNSCKVQDLHLVCSRSGVSFLLLFWMILQLSKKNVNFLISDHFMRIWNLFGIIESRFGFQPYDLVLFLSIITIDGCGGSWLLEKLGRFTWSWGETWTARYIWSTKNRRIYIYIVDHGLTD